MAARPSKGVVGGAEFELSGFLTQVKNFVLGGELSVPDTSGGPKLPHWGDKPGESYTVESPADADLTLETANKIMDQDFTVKKICYHETVNQAGGKTVYIANKD